MPPVLLTVPEGYVLVDDQDWPLLVQGKFGSVVGCNRCGGATAIAICPNCHSLVPDGLREGSLSIGVVGARNSGKTVFLSLLEQQLMMHVPERFHAAVDHPGGTVGLANDLVENREMMELSNRLPAQTPLAQGQKQAPAVYRWKNNDKKGSTRILSLYDTAGEDVKNRDRAMTQQHLLASDAVVFVIDPLAIGDNRRKAQIRGVDPGSETLQHDVLDGLVSVLRQVEQTKLPRKRSGKLSTPLAVVVTKMDAVWDEIEQHSPLLKHGSDSHDFDEQESLAIHEELRGLLHAWGGASLVNKIDSEFGTARFFGISALGGEPDYADGRTAPPRPTRVLDPLLWLLSRDSFLPIAPTPKGS